MLRRSEENLKAALLLLGGHNYDGSAVAFYYSVLQRMMYALNEAEKRPLAYENQNPLNEELHHKVLQEIINRIGNKKQEDDFEELFEELFNLRKKADYSSDSICQEECVKCRDLYEKLMARLDRFFPVRAA